MIINCEYCGKEFYCAPSRYNNSKHHCCSRKCALEIRKINNESTDGYFNCVCPVCGKRFHLKKCVAEDGGMHCCSKECHLKLSSDRMQGSGNPQYGLKGCLNASWKSDDRITTYGYKKIRCLDHPFRDCDGFVLEHRLVAEQYLLNDENSVEINGHKYLNPDLIVHHINGNKLDNRVENLIIETRQEHSRYHTSLIRKERNSLGQFI